MSEALTYASLLTDVVAYAERGGSEFTSQIPRFVMLAENRLASEIKGLGFLRIVNFDMTTSNPVCDKPARWRQTVSFSILVDNEAIFLKSRGLQYLQSYWPNQSLTDIPLFYADYDFDHWLVGPTSSDDFTATVNYYERPTPLDGSNQTNWTTQYAPQLLLYATLLEAQPFLKNSERINEFQALYDRAATTIDAEHKARAVDQSSVRGHK